MSRHWRRIGTVLNVLLKRSHRVFATISSQLDTLMPICVGGHWGMARLWQSWRTDQNSFLIQIYSTQPSSSSSEQGLTARRDKRVLDSRGITQWLRRTAFQGQVWLSSALGCQKLLEFLVQVGRGFISVLLSLLHKACWPSVFSVKDFQLRIYPTTYFVFLKKIFKFPVLIPKFICFFFLIF